MKKLVFNEEDYKSGDGMMTSVWGPPLWHSLHTISFNYPVEPTEKHKKDYMAFFKSLKNVLPCKYCRENYKKNIKELGFGKGVFKDRDSLSRWVFELHEKVNKNLGKESGLTFEEVRDRYEHFRSRCLTDPEKKQDVKVKEKGCTEPLYGVKSKCVLNIIPKDDKIKSLNIDKRCNLFRQKKK
jgi:hypothetical protein